MPRRSTFPHCLAGRGSDSHMCEIPRCSRLPDSAKFLEFLKTGIFAAVEARECRSEICLGAPCRRETLSSKIRARRLVSQRVGPSNTLAARAMGAMEQRLESTSESPLSILMRERLERLRKPCCVLGESMCQAGRGRAPPALPGKKRQNRQCASPTDPTTGHPERGR